MSGLVAALRVEMRKAASARVLHIAAGVLVLGAGVLGLALTGAVASGNAQITAKLGQAADAAGWPLLLAVVTQVAAAGSLLAFGIAHSWVFGREFTDGTVYGLFALPVSRAVQAAAKLLVALGWSLLTALALTAAITAAGFALGLGAPDEASAAALVRLCAMCAMNGLVAVPTAWAATLGRGPLAGVGTTIGLLVLAQTTVVAAPAAGAWLPIAAPALWALQPGAVTAFQLTAVAAFAIASAVLIARTWRRLQLDR
ncbi:ABC transporter permease [Glycomyces sp. MUSA5-2]|uniref:ABC transporter permease n=1 Tax=Glycomyces sp. MUSA5-2 TaxID=2053002 RepID=UPI003009D412